MLTSRTSSFLSLEFSHPAEKTGIGSSMCQAFRLPVRIADQAYTALPPYLLPKLPSGAGIRIFPPDRIADILRITSQSVMGPSKCPILWMSALPEVSKNTFHGSPPLQKAGSVSCRMLKMAASS